jgi:hypothetical protein
MKHFSARAEITGILHPKWFLIRKDRIMWNTANTMRQSARPRAWSDLSLVLVFSLAGLAISVLVAVTTPHLTMALDALIKT